MEARWVAWLRARGIWILGGIGFVGAAALVYFLPLMLVPEAGLNTERRLKAENDLRTTFVQAIGGAIVLVGTARTLHINREGQITERFTRAIDQLGQIAEDKLDVRLGGIYALERIARDSKPDRGPIIEVLTAFLREHARWDPELEQLGLGRSERPGPRADFQAVATVLGRNRWPEGHRVSLPQVDLRRAHFSGAQLRRADLAEAHLEGADLAGADLRGAMLSGADLQGAYLGGADLRGADLSAADLKGANLGGAHLEGAYLGAADLTQASLKGAHLEKANFNSAWLEGANLDGAHLEGANLGAAKLGDAFLGEAHLEGAILGGADLGNAFLGGAHLDGVIGLDSADLQGVIGLDPRWKGGGQPRQ